MVQLEWTFFVAAHLALWFFSFVAETVLIQHPSLGWVLRHFPLLPLSPPFLSHPAANRDTGRGHRHDRCSELAKGVFHTMEQCSAIKVAVLGAERGGGGWLHSGCCSEISGDLPASVSRQLIPSLSLVSHHHLSLTYSTVYLDPQSFSSFWNRQLNRTKVSWNDGFFVRLHFVIFNQLPP